MATRKRKTPAKSRKTGTSPNEAAKSETTLDPGDPVVPAVNPVVEDHLTPAESLPYPIVAIGASAGGL